MSIVAYYFNILDQLIWSYSDVLNVMTGFLANPRQTVTCSSLSKWYVLPNALWRHLPRWLLDICVGLTGKLLKAVEFSNYVSNATCRPDDVLRKRESREEDKLLEHPDCWALGLLSGCVLMKNVADCSYLPWRNLHSEKCGLSASLDADAASEKPEEFQ